MARREPRPDIVEVLLDGVPLVIWQDGEVVHVPPDELPDLPDERAPSPPIHP